jgi:hypothetical protein
MQNKNLDISVSYYLDEYFLVFFWQFNEGEESPPDLFVFGP